MKRPIVCLVSPLLILHLCQQLDSQRNMAAAQDPKPSGGLEIAEIKGDLESVSNNPPGLKVKSEDGESYVAVLARQATLKYSGTADPQFLKPGLYVRFVAPFYPQTLLPQAPITALEIFRPAKQRRMTREQLLSQTPGIHPLPEKEKEKGKESSSKPPPPGMKNYQVVGQLRAVQEDKLQIAAGKFPVMAKLDPSATVKISSGDTFFCLPGDIVELSGLRNPSQATLIQAETVEITGANALGAPSEEQSQKPTRRSRLDRNKR